jgi:hypothetical protein
VGRICADRTSTGKVDDLTAGTITRPRLRQIPALLEQITAAESLLPTVWASVISATSGVEAETTPLNFRIIWTYAGRSNR